jgi:hypothetical protein
VKDRRGQFTGGTDVGAATPASAPGKRTRTSRIHNGAARVRRGGAQAGGDATAPTGATPDLGVIGGGSPADPTGGGGGDGSVQNAPGKPKVTVTFQESAAPPLTFNAKDYRELYGQVAARAGREAGSVKRTPSYDYKDDGAGHVTSVDFTYKLETMLPEWPQKAQQPQGDQAKFTAWRDSVSAHEAQHRAIYKTELAKLKTQVIGPTLADVDTQEAAVEAAAETAQDAFDASNQPAPLAAPGGIEKVPNGTDGGGGTAASAGNDLPAGDGGTATA